MRITFLLQINAPWRKNSDYEKNKKEVKKKLFWELKKGKNDIVYNIIQTLSALLKISIYT